MAYTNYASNSTSIGDDSVILTNTGHEYINTLYPKLVRGWNGMGYSYTKINKPTNKQQLFSVQLADGRSLKCSLSTEFIVGENGESMSLNDLIMKKRTKKIPKIYVYTNIAMRTDCFDYIEMLSVKLTNEVCNYCITTIDSNHRAFINDIMIRCW